MKLLERLVSGLGLSKTPAGPHACRFVPIKRGYDLYICKCGSMKIGKNTITTRPGGAVDLIRWSASQAAIQAGDLAMNVTNGRPRAFIQGASQELGSGIQGVGPNLNWAFMQEPGTSTYVNYGNTNFTQEGSRTRSAQAEGDYIQNDTAGGANSDAGLVANPFTHTQRRWNPIFSAAVRTGGTITSIRNWVGFFSADPMASATPAVHLMAFRYDTGADGTAFWRCVTDNGSGTPTVTTTTVAYVASTSYALQMYAVPGGGSVVFLIDGNTVATHTLTLPTSTQDMGAVVEVRNLVAAVRSFLISHVQVSQLPGLVS